LLVIVQFRVTEPDVPPPLIPVPAVTPVMSPALLVKGRLLIVVSNTLPAEFAIIK